MEHRLTETTEVRSMMKDSFGDSKLDKSNELNSSMTIKKSERDSYDKSLHSLGGNE